MFQVSNSRFASFSYLLIQRQDQDKCKATLIITWDTFTPPGPRKIIDWVRRLRISSRLGELDVEMHFPTFYPMQPPRLHHAISTMSSKNWPALVINWTHYHDNSQNYLLLFDNLERFSFFLFLIFRFFSYFDIFILLEYL